MKPTLAACSALLALATACGSDDGTDTAAAVTPVPAATATAAPAASAAAPAASAPAAATVLVGTVGSPGKPDAFVITLADSSGEPVTTVPAGRYQIRVSDPSKIHNFHLTGGGIDETTAVPEVKDSTFDVTLEPGGYTYICDPHPRMVGTLTVT